MLKEFKTFAMRGNVVDMAVGVIIGAALGSVVTSLVNDIIMPPIGLVLGGVDFSQLAFNLNADGSAQIRWGAFLNTVISFVVIAFVVWRISKAFVREEPPEPAPEMKTCPWCRELIPVDATRCRACTSDLRAAAPLG